MYPSAFFQEYHGKMYQLYRRKLKKAELVPPISSSQKPTLPPATVNLQVQKKGKERREKAWPDTIYCTPPI
jgi:hypothetical protein